ncbi:MAG: response regulator transcription factor [Actinomycetota bacterium]
MQEATTPRVLVVDDDPLIVRLLELNFRLAGFEVSSASRGDRVLERATEVGPHAIVLDVTMPGLDGYEVCRRLREDRRFADVPVVFLTAHDPDDRVRRAELGPVHHVSKPFDPETLVATVRAAMDRGKDT